MLPKHSKFLRQASLVACFALVAAGMAPSAQTLTCGSRIAASITAPGQIHAYTFVIPTGAPTPVDIYPLITDLTEVDPGFEACFEIYRPDQTYMAYGCYGIEDGTNECSMAGEYTIYVYDGADPYDHRGSYALSLLMISAQSTCGSPMSCGQTITGSLCHGEVDSYTFEVPAGIGTVVVAPTIVDLVDLDPGFEAWFEIYRPDGSYLGSGGYGLEDGGNACAVPGTYTIVVYDGGSNGNFDHEGSYTLNLQMVSANGTCGGPIACGQTISGLSNQGVVLGHGNVHSYTFDVPSGTQTPVVVTPTIADIAEIDPGFEAWFELYRPDGAYMGSGEYGFYEGSALCTMPGTYTLLVFDGAWGSNHDREGSYTLNLQFLSSGSTCGEPLPCGGDISRPLELGEVHSYAFEVPSSGSVIIAPRISDLVETDAGFEACVELYSPEGAYLGGACDAMMRACSRPGKYTLLVFDDQVDDRGTCRFQLKCKAMGRRL